MAVDVFLASEGQKNTEFGLSLGFHQRKMANVNTPRPDVPPAVQTPCQIPKKREKKSKIPQNLQKNTRDLKCKIGRRSGCTPDRFWEEAFSHPGQGETFSTSQGV